MHPKEIPFEDIPFVKEIFLGEVDFTSGQRNQTRDSYMGIANATSVLYCLPFSLKTWHYELKSINRQEAKDKILHLILICLILDLSLLQDVVDVVGRRLGSDVRVLPVVRVPGGVVGHFVRLQELLRQNIGHFSSNSSVVFRRPGSTKLYFDLKANSY